MESRRLAVCMAHYKSKRFGGLFGTPDFGFEERNLDFLYDAKNANWLWFWDVALESIDALYELKVVREIGINPKRPGIDFSRLPSLRAVTNHWIRADRGIGGSRITRYRLLHFNPRAKQFGQAEMPSRVEQLEMIWANPASLQGLPILPCLRELQLHRCPNLRDLSSLPMIAPALETLIITSAPRVNAEHGVRDHPNLSRAQVNGIAII
ncbi:MAG: hypothetical protein R3E77_10370 [Steroidobacteraceae bacterium]